MSEEAEETGKAAVGSPVERVREAAKWLIGAFAAIAVLLLGGIQVSSVGQLTLEDDPGRLIVAGCGFLLGLGATLYAILQNVRILMPQAMTVGRLQEEDLRKYFDDNPELLAGCGDTVAELVQRYRDAATAYEAAEAKQASSPSEANEVARALAADQYLEVEDDLQKVFKVANWRAIESLFNDDVRIRLGVAAAVAAVAIGLFAWAANPPEDESPRKAVIPPAPVLAHLSVEPDAKATLRQALGKRCQLTVLRVLEIGGKREEPEVMTLPERGCRPARLLVPAGVGIVTAVPSISAPAP